MSQKNCPPFLLLLENIINYSSPTTGLTPQTLSSDLESDSDYIVDWCLYCHTWHACHYGGPDSDTTAYDIRTSMGSNRPTTLRIHSILFMKLFGEVQLIYRFTHAGGTTLRNLVHSFWLSSHLLSTSEEAWTPPVKDYLYSLPIC